MPARAIRARDVRFCRPCDRSVVAPRPRLAGSLGLGAVALGMVIAVLGASLIGPFIMFAIPLIAIFGFALGPLAEIASRPAICPHCRREVLHASRADGTRSEASRTDASRTDASRTAAIVVHRAA